MLACSIHQSGALLLDERDHLGMDAAAGADHMDGVDMPSPVPMTAFGADHDDDDDDVGNIDFGFDRDDSERVVHANAAGGAGTQVVEGGDGMEAKFAKAAARGGPRSKAPARVRGPRRPHTLYHSLGPSCSRAPTPAR